MYDLKALLFQLVKSPEGGQQVYYPIPPKTLVPNLEARSDSQCIKGNMVVNPISSFLLHQFVKPP